jgi:hypothetical protein
VNPNRAVFVVGSIEEELMRVKSLAAALAALALPILVTVPSEAKTAYQYWAQGQGAYVSSTDHPPFELQGFLVGGADYPDGLPGAYYGGQVPPPYGYGYGPGPYDPAY